MKRHIKFLLELFAVSFLAISVVVLSFSSAYGIKNSIKALFVGLFHLGDVSDIANSENEQNVLSLQSSNYSTSTGDNLYKGIDLSNYQVKPIFIESKVETILSIPTSGIAAHRDFLYHEKSHPGVDIWTNVNGKGLNDTSKGYLVYAACSGVVIRVFYPNEEVEIACDGLGIKILYSHMGDAVSKVPYHKLKVGQKVLRDEAVGYQGNISSFYPENRVTHLHFGVYDLKTGKPFNPAPYIGFSEIYLGQVLSSDK